jgi:hypothetical protein
MLEEVAGRGVGEHEPPAGQVVGLLGGDHHQRIGQTLENRRRAGRSTGDGGQGRGGPRLPGLDLAMARAEI